jgi:hypothetical protein
MRYHYLPYMKEAGGLLEKCGAKIVPKRKASIEKKDGAKIVPNTIGSSPKPPREFHLFFPVQD